MVSGKEVHGVSKSLDHNIQSEKQVKKTFSKRNFTNKTKKRT